MDGQALDCFTDGATRVVTGIVVERLGIGVPRRAIAPGVRGSVPVEAMVPTRGGQDMSGGGGGGGGYPNGATIRGCKNTETQSKSCSPA